jgi:hypothetical protein
LEDLLHIIAYWWRKTREVVFTTAWMADAGYVCDRYYHMAVMAGHRDACRIFYFLHPNLFGNYPLLKLFNSFSIRLAFYGHYCPLRYEVWLNDKTGILRSLFWFKDSEIHGIEFFKLIPFGFKMGSFLLIVCDND